MMSPPLRKVAVVREVVDRDQSSTQHGVQPGRSGGFSLNDPIISRRMLSGQPIPATAGRQGGGSVRDATRKWPAAEAIAIVANGVAGVDSPGPTNISNSAPHQGCRLKVSENTRPDDANVTTPSGHHRFAAVV